MTGYEGGCISNVANNPKTGFSGEKLAMEYMQEK
jgi:hypothetical protein